LILRLRDIKVRLNEGEYKRKLKIFGIANDVIPFVIHLIGLILQCVLLWIIFIKTKEKYLADAYIAGICFISIFIGMFFFAIWIEVYPYFSSYDKMINSPDCCP